MSLTSVFSLQMGSPDAIRTHLSYQKKPLVPGDLTWSTIVWNVAGSFSLSSSWAWDTPLLTWCFLRCCNWSVSQALRSRSPESAEYCNPCIDLRARLEFFYGSLILSSCETPSCDSHELVVVLLPHGRFSVYGIVVANSTPPSLCLQLESVSLPRSALAPSTF